MDCPACGRLLTELTIRDVTVDACQGGCGGVWFDKHEIEAFDEAGESAEPLLEIPRDAAAVPDTGRHGCPRCQNIVMQRHFFCHRFEVEVDECAGCGGLWLDHSELEAVRGQYATAEERDLAQRQFVQRELVPELSALTQRDGENEGRADRIAGLFRWLCPSAWIPGRQSWGSH